MNSDSDWAFVDSGELLTQVGETMSSDWTSVDPNRFFAIAKCGFYPSEDLQRKFQSTLITLHLGDKVKIKAENGNWVLIFNLSSLLTGLVPRSYLFEAPFESHPYGSTLILRPKRKAALQEVTDVLQEWHAVLVQLYLEHSPEFLKNQLRFKLLEGVRQRLHCKIITSDRRKKTQKEIGTIIDEGNMQLGLDARARNPDGTELQPGSMSMVEYFQRYRDWAQGKGEDSNEDVDSDFKSHRFFSLFVTVQEIIGAVPGHGLKFFLYDGKEEISESASFYVTDQDQTPLKILFRDLDTTDTNRDELYLAATIFRYGPIVADKNETSGLKLRIPCGVALSNITFMDKGRKQNNCFDGHMTYFPFAVGDKCLRSTLERNRTLATCSDDSPLQWCIKFDISTIRDSSSKANHPKVVAVRKMDFPSIILPTYTRNDLYLTLENGVFQKGSVEVTVTMHDGTEGLLSEPQKYKETAIQSGNTFTSSVYHRDSSPEWGETFAISLPDTVQDLASTYLRFSFTCRDTVKAKHAKPFAFAFIPLHQNGATAVKDGFHNLAVYKIDHKLNETTLFANSGLQSLKSLTTSKNHTSVLSFNSKSLFVVKTKLCSTKFTQDERLSSFLKYRTSAINLDETEHSGDLQKNLLDLKQVLLGLQDVSHMEGAKFLQQILEKLFNLSGNLSNQYIDHFKEQDFEYMQQVSFQCDTEIFLCLIRIFDLVRSDRFGSFASIIDYYIQRNFSAGLACKKLVHTLVTNLLRFPKHRFSSMILEVVNNTEMLFKFVVRSYEILNAMVSQGVISQEQTLPSIKFSTLIAEYFRALKKILIREENNNIRAAILQSIPPTMEVLTKAVSCYKLINHWSDLVGLVQKQNSLEALGMLQDIVDSSLFRERDTCPTFFLTLLPSSILPHLTMGSPNSRQATVERPRPSKFYVNAGEPDRKASEPDAFNSFLPTNEVELADMAVKLLRNVIIKLHRTDTGPVEENILCLVQTLLKPILATFIDITSTAGVWELMFKKDLVAILLSFFSAMKPHHYKKLCQSWGREERGHSPCILTRADLQGCVGTRDRLELPQCGTQRERSISPGRPARSFLSFVETVSTCFQNLYVGEYFPAAWCDIILFQNKIILQVLHALAELLNSEFSEHFQMPPWLAFFKCATTFVTQPSLQLERFSTAKVCHIIQRFGDMRSKAAELVLNTWKSLETSKKRQFTSGKNWTVLQPFLQMTLVSEPNIRASGIPLFYDVIREEFRISVPPQNFKQVEKQFIQNLTDSVLNGYGDEGYIDIFDEIMSALFNEDETGIRDQGWLFIKTVKRFLPVLLDLRKTSKESHPSNRMTCYVRLMELCEEISDKDLYVRYLYKLYILQKQEQNFTEAAFVLGRHCQMLNWSEEPLASYLNSPLHPSAATHMELKEALYEDRILHLQNAQMYECALDLCNELYHLYGQATFEHDKLQHILQQMIDLVKLIDVRKTTPHPSYFRVGFYGGGFPAFLRDKEYIYRGKQFELPADFESRILDIYPYAEMIRTASPPSKEIIESSKQYLQVFDVKPVPGVCHGLPTASLGILRYYSRNHLDTFTSDCKIKDRMKKKDGLDNEFASLNLKRTTYTVSSAFPGILTWFPVIVSNVKTVRPIEKAIEFLQGFKDDLRTLIVEQHRALHTNRKYACTKNLQGKLRGVLESSVQGGIPNYEEAFLTPAYLDKNPADMENVLKLKDCIISLVPIIKAGLEIHGVAAKEAAPMQMMFKEQFSQFCDHIFATYRVNAELLDDSQLQKVVAKYSKRILASLAPDLLDESEEEEEVHIEYPATVGTKPKGTPLTRTSSKVSIGGLNKDNPAHHTPPLHPRRPTITGDKDVAKAAVLIGLNLVS